MAGRVLGYAGLVAGAAGLAVGTVYAVNLAGVATKPAGFETPADGLRLMPPTTGDQQRPTDGDSLPGQREPQAMIDAETAASVGDAEWVSRVAAVTGIPGRALAAYASADRTVAGQQPGCGLDWATLGAIGAIESDHGSYGGAVLDEDGYARPAIIGVPLDGNGFAQVADTDGGALDGDRTWDRAVGPMQFIPTTWATWGTDANGDGTADPNQIDDAALAAARYLCASGPMTTPEQWRTAILSYNHDNDYVDKVATITTGYAAATTEGR